MADVKSLEEMDHIASFRQHPVHTDDLVQQVREKLSLQSTQHLTSKVLGKAFMFVYFTRRLLYLIPMLLGISFLIYLGLELLQEMSSLTTTSRSHC